MFEFVGGTLGRTVLELRHNYLIQERYSLTFLLYLSAQSRLLTGIDITKLISALAESTLSGNETSLYLLCTILKALDPHAPSPNPLFTDPVFIKLVSQQLNFGSPPASAAAAGIAGEWKSPRAIPTKSLLQMKWALFGRAALAANVRPGNGFTEDTIESSIKLAIEHDAFTALLALVFLAESAEKNKFGRDPLSYAFALRSELNDNGLTAAMGGRVKAEFRECVLETVRDACLDLIGDAPTVLRSVRIRQEDLLGASAHRPPHHHHHPSNAASTSSNPQPRTDISIFFILLGTLYTLLPPDSAVDFFTPLDPKLHPPSRGEPECIFEMGQRRQRLGHAKGDVRDDRWTVQRKGRCGDGIQSSCGRKTGVATHACIRECGRNGVGRRGVDGEWGIELESALQDT